MPSSYAWAPNSIDFVGDWSRRRYNSKSEVIRERLAVSSARTVGARAARELRKASARGSRAGRGFRPRVFAELRKITKMAKDRGM